MQQTNTRPNLTGEAAKALLIGLIICGLRIAAIDYSTLFSLDAIVNHDILSGASIFAANMHSLRLSGDLAWWLPGPEGGYAQYYNFFLSPLAPTAGNPVFLIWSGVYRLATLVGVSIPEYVQFLGFNYVLMPILAYAALILLCRTFCRSWIAPTLAAVIYAYGGPGLWNNSWMFYQEWANIFFFLWALDRFVQRNSVPRLALFSVAIVVIVASANYWTIFSMWFVLAWLVLHASYFRGAWHRSLRWLWSVRRSSAFLISIVAIVVTTSLWATTLGLVLHEEGAIHIRRPPPFDNSYSDVDVYWRADTAGVRGWTTELFNPVVERPIANYKVLNEVHNARYIGIGLLPLLLIFLVGGRKRGYDRLLFSVAVVLVSVSATSGIFMIMRRAPGFTGFLHIFYFYQYFLQIALILISARALDILTRKRLSVDWSVAGVCAVTSVLGAGGLAHIFLNSEQYQPFDLALKSIGYASILLLTATGLIWQLHLDRGKRAFRALAMLFLLFMTGDLLHYYTRGTIADQAFTRSADFRDLPPVLPDYMKEPMAASWSVRNPERFDGGLFANLPFKNSVWPDNDFNPSTYKREFLALDDQTRAGAAIPDGSELAMAVENSPVTADSLVALDAGALSGSISEWSYDALTLQVVAQRAGTVLTRQAFDPGWRVKVDGSAVETSRANLKYLAFPVQAGTHTVTMTFWPWSRTFYPFACAAAMLSLLVLLAMSAFPSRFSRLCATPAGRRYVT